MCARMWMWVLAKVEEVRWSSWYSWELGGARKVVLLQTTGRSVTSERDITKSIVSCNKY